MDIGLIEEILIKGEKGKKKVLGLVDTGARRTSIDKKLAKEIGLKKLKKIVSVKNASGLHKRETGIGNISLKGEKFKIMVNLADREKMRFKVLIGRDIIYGKFKVDLKKTPLEYKKFVFPEQSF